MSTKNRKAGKDFLMEAVRGSARAEQVSAVADNGARVTVALGATIPFGDYGNVKPSIQIEGLNPYGDFEAQINDCLVVGTQAFARIDAELEVIITQLIAPQAGKPGTRDRVEELEKTVAVMRENMRRVIERLKAQDAVLATLTALVNERRDGPQE